MDNEVTPIITSLIAESPAYVMAALFYWNWMKDRKYYRSLAFGLLNMFIIATVDDSAKAEMMVRTMKYDDEQETVDSAKADTMTGLLQKRKPTTPPGAGQGD